MKLSISPCAHSDPALELIPEPSSKGIDVLLNAKSRNVSWRICKSLWDRELAAGYGGDGQPRKHAGSWWERVGQGQYIFSFDVASPWGQALPEEKQTTVILCNQRGQSLTFQQVQWPVWRSVWISNLLMPLLRMSFSSCTLLNLISPGFGLL